MKILAFSPFDPAVLSGNSITLRRLQRALEARGHAFEIFPVSPTTAPGEAEARVRAFAPDVLHFYHAFKTGRLLAPLAARPSVLTISGTDLNQDLDDASKRPLIIQAVALARRVVTYNPSLQEMARRAMPRFAERIAVIPKGATLGNAPYDLRAAAGAPPHACVFFHPGGIRPVKNSLFAVDALAEIRRDVPPLCLVFAGPLLDENYGRSFLDRIRSEPWVRHLDRIPPEAMAAAYREADVVLNTSVSEGLSNALIEALLCGRAVLASDIPGNRDLIGAGDAGFLYRDRAEFLARARLLLQMPPLRESIGRKAREYAERTFSTEREAEALLEAYTAAVTADT
jgi:glycosyltransferase involved in cell wall biosynthesis